MGCGQRHGGHPGGATGRETGGGVLEDDAVGRVDAEFAGGEEIGLGVGLAAGDVVGGDHRLGEDPDGVEPGLGQTPGGGGDDGPAVGGQRAEEGLRAGQQTDAAVRYVLHLQRLDPGERLRHDVGGEQVGDYLDGRTPVQLDPAELLRDAVLLGPSRPAAVHGGQGGDEGAVVVEQESVRMDRHGPDPTGRSGLPGEEGEGDETDRRVERTGAIGRPQTAGSPARRGGRPTCGVGRIRSFGP